MTTARGQQQEPGRQEFHENLEAWQRAIDDIERGVERVVAELFSGRRVDVESAFEQMLGLVELLLKKSNQIQAFNQILLNELESTRQRSRQQQERADRQAHEVERWRRLLATIRSEFEDFGEQNTIHPAPRRPMTMTLEPPEPPETPSPSVASRDDDEKTLAELMRTSMADNDPTRSPRDLEEILTTVRAELDRRDRELFQARKAVFDLQSQIIKIWQNACAERDLPEDRSSEPAAATEEKPAEEPATEEKPAAEEPAAAQKKPAAVQKKPAAAQEPSPSEPKEVTAEETKPAAESEPPPKPKTSISPPPAHSEPPPE